MPSGYNCTFLKDPFCAQFSKDPLTIITSAWGALQLTWTIMLLIVHLTQVARNITTYETMRSGLHAGPLMTAVAAGTMSVEGAQVDAAGGGPDASPHEGHAHAHKKKKEGFLSQWSKLLGLDTFFTIAFQGYQGSQKSKAERRRNRKSNPFTRGLFKNCQDFWLDGPVFGRKNDSCKSRLGGEEVDYASLYDAPRGGMRYRSGYEVVPAAEEGEA